MYFRDTNGSVCSHLAEPRSYQAEPKRAAVQIEPSRNILRLTLSQAETSHGSHEAETMLTHIEPNWIRLGWSLADWHI